MNIEASFEVWSNYKTTVKMTIPTICFPLTRNWKCVRSNPIGRLARITQAVVHHTCNCVEAKWPLLGALLVTVQTKGNLYSSRDVSINLLVKYLLTYLYRFLFS